MHAGKALARTLCTAASEPAAAFCRSPSSAPLGTEGVAAVSHEVRMPLTAVLSAAELFRAKLKKENGEVLRTECEPYFFHLEHNLNRALHLAQSMAEAARFEAGADEYPQRTAVSGLR